MAILKQVILGGISRSDHLTSAISDNSDSVVGCSDQTVHFNDYYPELFGGQPAACKTAMNRFP